MSIAEKLETVAENQQKLYNAGALDYSPQETVSGTVFNISDILPIEHNIAVNVSGTEDLSTVHLYKGGKNLFNNDFSLIKEVTYITSSGAVGTRWGYEIYLPIGTYTINPFAKNSFNELYIYGCVVDANNNRKQTVNIVAGTLLSTITFTIESEYRLLIFDGWTSDKAHAEKFFSMVDIQLEVGETATEYESYVEPAVYDVQADGTVEGVNSIYPNTTLYTDTEGVIVEATYYQDGRKVKENQVIE